MYSIEKYDEGFCILLDGKIILKHTDKSPAFFLARGKEDIKMFRGNFDISDEISEKLGLACIGIENNAELQCEEFENMDEAAKIVSYGKNEACCEQDKTSGTSRFTRTKGTVIRFSHPLVQGDFVLSICEEDGLLRIKTHCEDEGFNRLYLRFFAEKDEHVLGGGEQFSCLDLRGKNFPIWTREQGVGRNKNTEITRLADAQDGSGGDYHTTFFPQPTFVSSRMYFVHLENYDYSELDFRNENYHEVCVWNTDASFAIANGSHYEEILYKLSGLLGRQPELPAWAMKGLWLGVQGGTNRALEMLDRCRAGGMDVSAVWIQDWEGKRVTSFGKRLQWDWRWNKEMYPGLDEIIKKDPATAWMGYINPYLVEGGVLFEEAKAKDYFVKNSKGENYLFDFGEFNCGVVDLTMPEAFCWYKEVIKTNLIGLGFRGWMADFGEYLPADAVCYGGSGLLLHNKWPMLWAKCNRLAVEESGKLSECVFFMRAGASGSQRYSTLTWAGDQCVDWSEDDGLPSVITASLSLGMSGFGLHTCDIGGYTTLFYLKRDKELLLRWLEYACFTPVLRTHEGNRPDSNVQIYQDDEIIEKSARLVKIHNMLLPYLSECVLENSKKGLPVQRPLFFEAPECDRAYERDNFEYMLGSDLLVAPVVVQGASTRKVWLPKGSWLSLWSGENYSGGEYIVDAPMGKIPVFYKKESKWAGLFENIGKEFR